MSEIDSLTEDERGRFRTLVNSLGHEIDLLRAENAELVDALELAVYAAEDARLEWDNAPSGMRAGKILIALAGGCKGYRPDTDRIHAILAKAKEKK
jgi:hypothetical protein